MLMPFGLTRAKGVTLKIDEQSLCWDAQYSMCNLQGCIASLSLTILGAGALKYGTVPAATAANPNGYGAANFSVLIAKSPLPSTGWPARTSSSMHAASSKPRNG